MTELKPCPFCGGEVRTENVDSYKHPCERWWVLCDCGVIFSSGLNGSYQSEQEAIAAWNQRAERTCNLVDRTEMFRADIDSLDTYWNFSCGHRMYGNQWEKPNYCVVCGAKVVE